MEPTKKMLIMNILDILKKYSDSNHTLKQTDIIKKLEKEYEMKVDRKAVKHNIEALKDMGYNIEHSETKRNTPNPKTGKLEENIKTSDYYLERDFTDPELRLLIDSLLFSTHIPYNQCKSLVEKLKNLSNVYFKTSVKHISTMPETRPQNPELFLTIEILDEAISKNKKVKFTYLEYTTKKKQQKKTREDGSIREYVVTPYQMAAKEGKYYLICNYDKYNDLSNYRIDRIKDVEILDEVGKAFKSLDGVTNRSLDLAEYMAEHIYMYSSGNTRTKFRIVKEMISDVIDLFGLDVDFSNETETHVDVTARVNERAMFQFAKNYAPDVLVLEPKSLVKRLKEDAEKTLKAYK